MRGEHKILVQNKRVKFELTVRRNITILRGDSATGKTTLINMINSYNNNGKSSGVELLCDKKCKVIGGLRWKELLSGINDTIVFIDEENKFIKTEEFADIIQKTDNYYVLITREKLPMLPYSINEIYGLRESRKYLSTKQTYNEAYKIDGA